MVTAPVLALSPQAGAVRGGGNSRPYRDRREVIGLVGSAAIAWPLAVHAQQSTKVARIGFLVTGALESPVARALLDTFRQGLRERGYVEGQNIVMEYRGADGKIERFPDLATELVRLKVDLIVAGSTPAARAVQQATTTIPIVSFAMTDPVGDGLVASLARPSGNITGSTFLGAELVPKRLALLKEALPKASRVAALWQPGAFGEHTTERPIEGDRGCGTDAGSTTSTSRSAASRRVRPRILHNDQTARGCPHRVPGRDALC
jgi:hypothetical protein